MISTAPPRASAPVCDIRPYRNDRFIGNELYADHDLFPCLDRINAFAAACDIELFVTSSTREPGRTVQGAITPPGYWRHRPESTLLYRLVAEHYPKFRDRRAAEGRPLPGYVEAEFESYLKCGRLEHGFLRVRCEGCHAEKLVAFSCCPQLETICSCWSGGDGGHH